MWYKEKYRIVTENPYNKEKLNGLEIIDTHSVGIKNVEQQHELVTLCLNLPNANDIDYHAFYHL